MGLPNLIALKRKTDKNQNSEHAAKNEVLFNKLFVDDSGYRLVSSSPKVFSAIHKEDFGENFYLSDAEMDSYIRGFIDTVNDNIDEVISSVMENNSNNNDLTDSVMSDEDIKLSLYRSFKSLYDKWISKSKENETSGYFYNSYGKYDDRTIFDHFSFVNRCGFDIGAKSVIDVNFLSNMSSTSNGEGPTKSLYEVITSLLSKNNFDFWPLPSFINFSETKTEDLEDMFRAFGGPLNDLEAKPNFVCMFIGGSSRSLDIPVSYCGNQGVNFQYSNDSFDVNDPTSYPEDFKEAGSLITAFKVRYGQETQSHFSTLELDQAEFKETQDSLLVIDALVNPKSGSQPSQAGKGNNIYDTYLTRSYTCNVTSLGNAMIQPLLFFKLENVPLFRGTYLITNVTHTITPHNIKTNFVGVRQPIVTVPLVTDAISLLDLSLIDVEQTDTTTNNSSSDLNSTTLPADQIFVDDKVYGDNSSKKCPSIGNITDGGVADAYKDGKKYKIRLCKVYGALINVEMAENLYNMVTAAQNAGVNLNPGSNFRTMETQIETARGYGCYKSGNFVKSDCSTTTAKPGFSKHQSGFAIDFKCGSQTICYPNEPTEWCRKNGATQRPNEYVCFKWLEENASKYKFYNFKGEAWHWSIDGT